MIIRTAFITLTLLVVGCASSPTGRSQFLLISPEAAILESEAAYLNTVGALDQESSMRINWLYFASRSDRDREPVLIWPICRHSKIRNGHILRLA